MDVGKRLRFVIWGAGARSFLAVNVLGLENVEVFVDQNKTLQSSSYYGKRVISPECFFSEYSSYPVMITPEGYEQEIKEMMAKQGIFWGFLFEDEYLNMETAFLQMPLNQFTNSYSPEKIQSIFGINLMSLCLYSYLEQKGFSCEIIPSENDSEELKQYVKNVLGMNLSPESRIDNEKRQIHLARKPVSKKDDERIQTYEDCYFAPWNKELFYKSRLEKFRGIHQGKRGFIVGTGPSLKIQDLDILERNHEISFSMNSIYKAFPRTIWRPDYYMIADTNCTILNKKHILEMEAKYKFVADIAWTQEYEKHENIFQWHVIRGSEHICNRIPFPMPKFTDDFSKGSYAGMTVTYDGCLQLAAFMGFSEIYLIGMDCSNYGTATVHFSDDYEGDEKGSIPGYLQVEKIILAYQSARNYADSHGFKIFNATRGGKLEVFQRVDFDSLFG